MFGNGAAIGTVITVVNHRVTLPVLQRAPAACCAVAVGATMRGAAGCRIGSATIRATATSTTAFGLFFFFSLRTDFPFSALS